MGFILEMYAWGMNAFDDDYSKKNVNKYTCCYYGDHHTIKIVLVATLFLIYRSRKMFPESFRI